MQVFRKERDVQEGVPSGPVNFRPTDEGQCWVPMTSCAKCRHQQPKESPDAVVYANTTSAVAELCLREEEEKNHSKVWWDIIHRSIGGLDDRNIIPCETKDLSRPEPPEPKEKVGHSYKGPMALGLI